MQKLTSDRLFYSGNDIKIKSVGIGKPKGTELIRRMRKSSQTVTIDMATAGSGNSETDVNPQTAINGTGSDANVYFDPTSNPSIPTKNPTTGNVTPQTGRPNQIGLGHELVHAERSMRGAAINYSTPGTFSYKNATGTTVSQTVPQEELAAVGLQHNATNDITENNLRNEQGVDERGAY
jgi:NleD-like pathogen effector protein (putative zinc metallopeptidase)